MPRSKLISAGKHKKENTYRAGLPFPLRLRKLRSRDEVREVYLSQSLTALEPDPEMTISEWADKFRMLSSKSSAEHGQWRTARTPYLRDIMDDLSPSSDVQRVVVKKASQMGLTEVANNVIGFYVHQAPCPILFVQPTTDLARRYSSQRVRPMFTESPSLAHLLRGNYKRDKSNSVLFKEYPGGILALTGANSPVGLSSMPIRIVLLDEVDRYPLDVGSGAGRGGKGEGDPCALAIARSRTFPNRKILQISSPVLADHSVIDREYLASDQRKYFVPCPGCKEKQILEWSRFKWEKGKPDTIHYLCAHCGFHILHHQKQWMIDRGEWRPTVTSTDPRVHGYFLPAFYAPQGWIDWPEIAKEWEAAQGHHEKLQAFINTVLGESWQEDTEAPDYELLYRRREHYTIGTVPAGVCFLTAGGDVQKDYIQLEVVGWGRNKESWSIDNYVFEGDTSQDKVWADLQNFYINVSYPSVEDPDVRFKIVKTAIDSRYRTQVVYTFARRQDPSLFLAIIGKEGGGQPIGMPNAVDVSTVSGKKFRRGIKVWPVATGLLKSELYMWLDLPYEITVDDHGEVLEPEGYPSGFCHFPEYGIEFFKSLTAEVLTTRGNKTYWKKIRERNEALDDRVYARAAASAFGIDRFTEQDWERLSMGTRRIPVSSAPPRSRSKRVIRSAFMSGITGRTQ